MKNEISFFATYPIVSQIASHLNEYSIGGNGVSGNDELERKRKRNGCVFEKCFCPTE